MKCLVTGACGFIGSHMVETLVAAGHSVRATDLPSSWGDDDPKAGRFPSVLKKLDVEFIPSDLTRSETLKPLVEGIDLVFHIAAVFSYSAPMEIMRRINVEGTRALCHELVHKGGVQRIVVPGAGGIFGTSDNGRGPMTEETPLALSNNYLRSKWEQEEVLKEFYARDRLPYSIVRGTGVYGPRGVYGTAQVLFHFAKQKILGVPRNFTARLPFIHVRDVAGSALYLATQPQAVAQDYNLVDDTTLNSVELGRIIARHRGNTFLLLPPVPIKLVRAFMYLAAWAGRLKFRLTKKTSKFEKDAIRYVGCDFWYSNQKLKNSGYRLKYPDARAGICETLDWYKKEGWL